MMAMLPKLKLKALVSFPSNVYGGTGIEVVKTNGNFTIDLDYREFAFSGTLPPNTNVLVWDPITDTYVLVPPSATSGISDAPSDSQTYGRNNAAWVQVTASGISDAPSDSLTYGRKNAAWVQVTAPSPATATPAGNGVGAVGVSLKYAREDHVHPAGTAGSGDVTGPASAVADNIATYNGATGKVIKDSGLSAAAVSGAVRYDAAQALTEAQKVQARSNIYAAPFDALAYNGMQINGSMEVSQELGTSGQSVGNKYICDGYVLGKAGTMVVSAQVSYPATVFASFTSLLYISVSTAQVSLGTGDAVHVYHPIEGYRIARLAWGTANAQPITIGFWTAHNRTGTYSVAIQSAASTRCYTTTYTQNVSSAREYKTVTILGDTGGTWNTLNSVGMYIFFAMAAGTTQAAPSANSWLTTNYIAAPGQINGVAATSDVFRITGVVVLPGIEAPSAERSALIMRPYDQELVTCMRYYERSGLVTLQSPAIGDLTFPSPFKVKKRSNPTMATIAAPALSNASAPVFNLVNPDGVSLQLHATAIGGYAANWEYSADARL